MARSDREWCMKVCTAVCLKRGSLADTPSDKSGFVIVRAFCALLDQAHKSRLDRPGNLATSPYPGGSASSSSFTSTSSIYMPFTNTLRDAHILSTITERTENPSSRPTSYKFFGAQVQPSRPVSDAIRCSAVSRGIAEPGPSTGTPSHRTGELIAFFEDKSSTSDNSSRPYLPHGHQRTGSVPAGPRSPGLYTQISQSVPTFTTTCGSNSRPSSPRQSWSSQSRSYSGFHLPNFVDMAYKQLRSDVQIEADVQIGECLPTLTFDDWQS